MKFNTKQLGVIAEVIMGQSPPGELYNHDCIGKPLITGAGQFGPLYPQEQKYSSSGPKVSVRDDILVCIRATIGDLNWSDKEYYLGRGVAAIRVGQKVDARYMWQFLKARKDYLQSQGTGSTFKQISRRVLFELEIPLPSLAEQKRIAAILDRADALREKRRQAIAKLDTLVQSVFLDMFGDPVTNPKGWDIQPLGQLCDVRDGTHDSPRFIPSGYPLVTSKNLKGGRLDLTDVSYISDEDFSEISRRSRVDQGDIIMPMIGTVGNPVLIQSEPEFAIKNLALFKFSRASISNTYVLGLLQSHYFNHIFSRRKRGGSQKFVSLTDLRSMPVPVPGPSEQSAYAEKLHKIETLLEANESIGRVTDNLFHSLQQRAFRGEL